MDLRRPVLAICVGGTPAPGINSVIAAVVAESISNGLAVVGIKDGFKHLKRGVTQNVTHRFDPSDIYGLHYAGGSFLKTSRATLDSAQEVENALHALMYLRARYLVTIGGSITAYSTSLVAQAATANAYKLSVVHVPKSIFNDLPLPWNAKTFGFETARQQGVSIVRNLKADARSMGRWYVCVVLGQKAGHLALGIAKAGDATMSLIPEEYIGGDTVTFEKLVTAVEGTMLKRAAQDRDYGVVIVTEGLVDLMDEKEIKERWGDPDSGHQTLGRDMSLELRNRFQKRAGRKVTVFSRNIGNECRAAEPNATDIELARDFGYGAMRFLMKGGTGCMVTMRNNRIDAMKLSDLVDPKTGFTKLRLVDMRSLSFRVAKKYETRITNEDLHDSRTLKLLCSMGGFTEEEAVAHFTPVLKRFPDSDSETDDDDDVSDDSPDASSVGGKTPHSDTDSTATSLKGSMSAGSLLVPSLSPHLRTGVRSLTTDAPSSGT